MLKAAVIALSCAGAAQAFSLASTNPLQCHFCQKTSSVTSAQRPYRFSGEAWQAQDQSRRSRGALKMALDSKTKMILREEAESPFRKVRVFVLYSFIAGAGVGFLVSFLRLLALTQGIDNGQGYGELASNLAIDLAAVAGSAYVIRNDKAASKGRLQRMELGAMLASLGVKLQDDDDDAVIQLSALRRGRGRDKRVAIMVGGASAIDKSLDSALGYSQDLIRSDLLIVPVTVERSEGKIIVTGSEAENLRAKGQGHVGIPVNLSSWQQYLSVEAETAAGQGIDVVETGFAIIIKKVMEPHPHPLASALHYARLTAPSELLLFLTSDLWRPLIEAAPYSQE
ncbi:unnamed protein product [Chrysoparadoxa australica]